MSTEECNVGGQIAHVDSTAVDLGTLLQRQATEGLTITDTLLQEARGGLHYSYSSLIELSISM